MARPMLTSLREVVCRKFARLFVRMLPLAHLRASNDEFAKCPYISLKGRAEAFAGSALAAMLSFHGEKSIAPSGAPTESAQV